MTKEEADGYVTHTLHSLVYQAYEEIELVLRCDPDLATRIPQLAKAYEHMRDGLRDSCVSP